MATHTIPVRTAITIAILGAVTFGRTLLVRPPEPKPAPPVPAIVKDEPKPVVPNFEIPPGSLDHFFDALRRTQAKEPGAITRILHYGDSPTTADSITADIRSLLQQRFGSAGHGYLLIAKPWAWYGHHGVTLDGKGWTIAAASQGRAPDGIHGLGGVSFRGGVGAYSRVGFVSETPDRAILYYLAQPNGGSVTISSGDTTLTELDTAAEEQAPAFHEFTIPPGTKDMELRVTRGTVRLFGYRFDRLQPGLQYSSLGVNGAQVQMVVRSFELRQWTANLRHENADLVILNYGTNESIFPAYIKKEYPGELRTVIQRVRTALPNASILLMSPMDRGVMEGGEIVTPPSLPELIEVQRKIAAETGCAFLNTYQAMGGAGTMAAWYRSQPRLVSADFMHPLPQGAAKVGALFEEALMAAFRPSAR